MGKTISLGKIKMGGNSPFVLIAGPCVIESRQLVFEVAMEIKKITTELGIPFIFKASYDKANRTSIKSFRGLGVDKGLAILAEVKERFELPVLSDVHAVDEVPKAANVLDVLQIPAFLCRQTDLILAAAKTGKVINIKKGQFLAPWDMKSVVQKAQSVGNDQVFVTERGNSFGYNNLVTDFCSIAIMKKIGCPVIFDATHSVQQPGGLGTASGGKSEFVPLMSRCGIAAGADGIFMEVHPDPEKALSDGPNMLPLNKLKVLLAELKELDAVVKKNKRI